MSLQTVTFKVSEESIAAIDEIAASRQVDRTEILRDALSMYLADHEDLLADLEEADRQIEAGDFVTHEEIVARYEARLRGAKAA
ncbi:CopG family ribbon-helix-helix protein [Granulicella mallensis]|jgi:predicted transcriptional regulator|uniref:Putative transcriptional regulator n=1 Tax=Granulicella mallensis TaxID=940614 RepID=A0A7W7ZS86_9BACT|nr:ribbon-helix-helix protein, CopG family [Granulicella mallensis]MBB5064828.1 putative transcriptional regulator [Granulicella mallensis]